MSQRRGYVPPPDRLRHELNIQEQVQERLRHLAENAIPGKPQKLSPRGVGLWSCFVPHRVKWPHKFVHASQNKDRVTSKAVTKTMLQKTSKHGYVHWWSYPGY